MNKRIVTLVGGIGWESVSFESLIDGLVVIFFPRLTDKEFIFNDDVLDGFLFIVPSTVVGNVNFLMGNEGLSGTTADFGIVRRSGGGPCCWSFSLFSYIYFFYKKESFSIKKKTFSSCSFLAFSAATAASISIIRRGR